MIVTRGLTELIEVRKGMERRGSILDTCNRQFSKTKIKIIIAEYGGKK